LKDRLIDTKEKVNLLGVQVDTLRLQEVLALISQAIETRQRILMLHVNVTALCKAYETAWFRRFLNHANLVFCDGMGVQLGARILGRNIPERFTLADWMWPLAEIAQERHYSFYFLGNPPGVAQRAAQRLQSRLPGLAIVGTQHGFFDHTVGSPTNQAVLAQINAARPNILMVGFGMPRQERWLSENWALLPEVNVAVSCGALFEYLSGDLKRGPHWMTDHYLEWLARLIISPRRYGWRYVRDNTLFLWRILRQKISGTTPS
jgi:N-acetylglucosaminyldiphosphoundecaprenol N-acetyl-beta-D-mannosaminyltransferase